LTATDLQIQVACEARSDQADQTQATTVSARKLQDILRSLPRRARGDRIARA